MANNVQDQFFTVGPFPLDAKTSVGDGYMFTTIEDLLERIGDTAISDGMIVQDSNYSVAWQLYKEGETWKHRLHQGMFYVDAVQTSSIDPGSANTLSTIDGVTGAEGNIVLCVGEFYPKDNGVWIMSEDGWYRHPIFDEDSDQLSGMFFKVNGGNTYKNSLWQLSNYGDITIGTTDVFFEQVLTQTEFLTNSIQAHAKYSKLYPLINGVVTLGINLVPGKEYIIKKENDIDATIVIRSAGTFEYLGTLSKEGDWLRLIPITDSQSVKEWYVMSPTDVEKRGTTFVTEGTTGDIYLEKEDVYSYYGVNSNDENRIIYLPIDCYDNFVYYIFHASYIMSTSKVYDYDGNLLSEVTGGDDATIYVKPAETKYCTAKNVANANAELKIKIPPGWKLKDLIVEHAPTTTQATGSFTCSTTDPTLGDTFTIGDETYTVVSSRRNKYEVSLNATPTTFAQNIVNAITADSKYVTAVRSSANVNMTAKEPYLGTAGNSITITESSTGMTVSGAALSGGTTTWPGDVTIDIGTSSGDDDVVSSQAITAQSLNTISINKIFSLTDATTLFVSSADWNSAAVNIYATRDEGISKAL